ncbi:MAG: type IIL restriction-modification enzyme MmeI [Chloroherpetonaceae bacterium]|nr:type IIL restriction-modification enzyme MmeI [Chloroherpetonaceae bacterium]
MDAKDIIITKKRKPICNIIEISFGSMPNDGGNFLFTDEEKNIFISKEPASKKLFRPLISAYEFLNGEKRWCLWLKDIEPRLLNDLELINERIENVRKHRSRSSRKSTQKLAQFPSLFGENRQPENEYVLIPRHSSENRKYIPMGFFDKNSIVSDSCLYIEGATHFHFGVLMSNLHMSWVKYICGRIKSDYRYSNELVYNNFPWPENPSEKQVKAIEDAAQKVMEARAAFPQSSLAVLYDPLTMPPQLVKAHQELDKAVDLAYRPQPFTSDANRMEFLFSLYEKYTAELFTEEKSGKSGKSGKRKGSAKNESLE